MRCLLLRASALLVLAALHAHGSWTDPVPVGSLKIVQGCGTDAGSSIQVFSLSNTTFFRKSSAPGSAIADRILLASAMDGQSAQAFALLGFPSTSYQFLDADGACHSANAVEATGLALYKQTATTGAARRTSRAVPELRRLGGNRVLIPLQGEFDVWSSSGARFRPVATPSAAGRILDLSALPSGPIFLRIGGRTHTLSRL